LHKPSERLDAAHFGRVRAFRALGDFKAELVTFAKLIELYVLELVGVEKDILFLTFDFDEPESLIGETGDSSFLHGNEKMMFVIASRQESGVELDPYLTGSGPGLISQ
jgi:hypothetical protein